MPHRRVRQAAVPFEVVGLTGFLAGAVLVLAGGDFPASIEEVLPHWAQIVWASGLALGSAAGLAGLRWQHLDGVRLEAGGVWLAGCACVAYAVALGFVQSFTSIAVIVGIIAGFGVACLWRAIQLMRELRRINRAADVAAAVQEQSSEQA